MLMLMRANALLVCANVKRCLPSHILRDMSRLRPTEPADIGGQLSGQDNEVSRCLPAELCR